MREAAQVESSLALTCAARERACLLAYLHTYCTAYPGSLTGRLIYILTYHPVSDSVSFAGFCVAQVHGSCGVEADMEAERIHLNEWQFMGSAIYGCTYLRPISFIIRQYVRLSHPNWSRTSC